VLVLESKGYISVTCHNIHKPWYRQVVMLKSHLELYASLLHFLRRIVRILFFQSQVSPLTACYLTPIIHTVMLRLL
jgi:hypothetical protein